MANVGKRVRRREGDIVRIDLGDGVHSYAQVSYEPLIVFFDGVFATDLAAERIAELPAVFRLWVHNDAIKKGIWPVVGHQPLSAANLAEPFFYKQDAISGRLTLYHSSFADTGWERPASISDCEGLECAAVWDPEHVADRLRDHFAGRPNKWVESLKIDRRAFS